jgi:hypothetical protein
VTEKTIAVLDGCGRGMPYIKINGKVAYTKQSAIDWLASKICGNESQKNGRGRRRSKNEILLKK